MSKISKRNKILVTILIIAFILLLIFSIYKHYKIKLFDSSTYKVFYRSLEVEAENFSCQKDMQKFITNWADDNKINYTLDENKNIIFTREASKKKAKLSPTVIIANYNYENAIDNKKLIASAATIAKSKIKKASKYTVIFVNNIKNDGSNYYNLDKTYFPSNSKVIYLDYGKLSYISTNSFNSMNQTFKVPTKTVESKCDTAIKIRIDGLNSDCIDTSISKRANPIVTFGSLLTRLKSKSTICELADIQLHNKGNMYPDELKATIMLNSYSLESFTSYLDKRIDSFEKAYKDKNENCRFTYKVIKKASKLPNTVYSKDTLNSLTTLLYTINNGTFRFEEDNVIPDGYELNDIYGIIAPNQLRVENGTIYLDVYSQAVNNKYINKIKKDNLTVSKFSKCEIINSIDYPKFDEDNKLLRKLQSTYFKVSDLGGSGMALTRDYDTYFTPMTYLNDINNRMSIVHIKENSMSAGVIANMILCYIQTRGNFLSL